MARTKSESNAERDRRICLYRRNGFTFSEIAQMEGLSRVRVSQIIAEAHSELPEEETRAEIASLLEFAERKAVELINEPGYVCGPNGRVVESPDGEPLPNKTIVDNALKTLILVADRKSRLYGTDKQQKRETPLEEAQRQMQAVMAQIAARKAAEDAQRELSGAERRELEEYRRQRAAVVPGEVLAELPPGGA